MKETTTPKYIRMSEETEIQLIALMHRWNFKKVDALALAIKVVFETEHSTERREDIYKQIKKEMKKNGKSRNTKKR